MKKILVTGGCGYIGAHTVVDLLQHGYEVVSIDNNSRSNPHIVKGIERITGIAIKNYAIDLCDAAATRAVFEANPDIAGIIHFAAYKAVGESVEFPMRYYENNLVSLINILNAARDYNVGQFVFSSSCTVYGNPAPDAIPVTESSPLMPAESPYGATKQMGEIIVRDFAKAAPVNAILLRYFNPVGAHPSNELGELPIGRPANLVPAITQTAIGKLPMMHVHGHDYPTRDGSCVRDYIHVSDIAHAHTLALNYLLAGKSKDNPAIFNLGTGDGFTVLEVIQAFEKVSDQKLNYQLGPRRAGDVVAIYANNEKARTELGWIPKYTLDDMMDTAWKWELKVKEQADPF